ncbi:MAG: tetratricopeptide repeat protein [Candidatus Omnitrophica bacterium]|nr:tetratricopeptide repeat protein [Candidatus Omnitrophota bacterium]
MSASKMDHKEFQRRLKEDELAHFLDEFRSAAVNLYENYGRQIVLGLSLIAVIMAAGYFWRVKSSNDFAYSQQLYSNAVAYSENDQHAEALTELNSLLDDYPNSQVAVLARVLRGDCYVKMGEFNNALNDYRQALPLLKTEESLMVRFAIVQSLRSLVQPDEALRELDVIEQQAKSPIVKEQVAYLRGCCYEDKGENAKAVEIFKTIPPESRWYNLAIEKINWLEAEPVPAINS